MDPDMRKAFETHVREFGQTPRQLFKSLHPRKGQKAYDPVATLTKDVANFSMAGGAQVQQKNNGYIEE